VNKVKNKVDPKNRFNRLYSAAEYSQTSE